MIDQATRLAQPLTRYWWVFVVVVIVPWSTSAFALLSTRLLVDDVPPWLEILLFQFPFVWGVLHLALYFPIRDLNRPLLRLVWGYILAQLALDTLHVLLLWAGADWNTLSWPIYFCEIVLLVWFAGQARQLETDQGIVVIGVSLVMGNPNMPGFLPDGVYQWLAVPVFDWAYNVPWWSAWIIIVLLAVWTLGRSDLDNAPFKKGLAALFGFYALAHFLSPFWFGNMVNLAIWVLEYSLIALFVYRNAHVYGLFARLGRRAQRYWEGDFG